MLHVLVVVVSVSCCSWNGQLGIIALVAMAAFVPFISCPSSLLFGCVTYIVIRCFAGCSSFCCPSCLTFLGLLTYMNYLHCFAVYLAVIV